MDWSSLVTQKLDLGGREVPVILIAGLGVAGVFVVTRLRRASNPLVNPSRTGAANTTTATDQQAQAQAGQLPAVSQDQFAQFTAELDSSLNQARADYLGQLADQISQVQAEYTGGLSNVQQQFTGQLAGLQSNLENVRSETQATLQQVQAQALAQSQQTTGKLNDFNARLTTVEAQQTKTGKAVRNIMRYDSNLTSSLLAAGTLPQRVYDQSVTPFVQQVVVPYGALGQGYEAL